MVQASDVHSNDTVPLTAFPASSVPERYDRIIIITDYLIKIKNT
jgi:hypothetical protein